MKFKNDVEIQNSDLIVAADIYTTGDTLKIQAGGTNGTYIEIEDTTSEVVVGADISIAGAAYINQLGPTGARTEKLQVNENMLISNTGTGAASLHIGASNSGPCTVQIGRARTADGLAYLDFQSEGTGSVDPGFRILRSSGANSSTAITHYGTANLTINASNGADTVFTNTNVGIGATSPAAPLHVRESGNSTSAGYVLLVQSQNGGGDYANTSGFYKDSSQNMQLKLTAGSSSNTVLINSAGISYFNGGNVGIGTTSPSAKLEVSSSDAQNTIRLTNTDTTIDTGQEPNAIEFYTNDASASGTGVSGKISQVAENPGNQYGLAFSAYNLGLFEAMRINEDGNVGIGTDSPSEKLQVVGNTLLNGIFFSTGYGQQFISTGTGTTINFGQPTSYVQNVYVQGKIQANSSVRVGDNVAAASYGDAGAIRYRVSGNNSYMDMCMRTGNTTYAWVNIVQNQW